MRFRCISPPCFSAALLRFAIPSPGSADADLRITVPMLFSALPWLVSADPQLYISFPVAVLFRSISPLNNAVSVLIQSNARHNCSFPLQIRSSLFHCVARPHNSVAHLVRTIPQLCVTKLIRCITLRRKSLAYQRYSRAVHNYAIPLQSVAEHRFANPWRLSSQPHNSTAPQDFATLLPGVSLPSRYSSSSHLSSSSALKRPLPLLRHWPRP